MLLTITKTFLSAPVTYSLMALITVVSSWAIIDQRLFFQLLLHPSGIVESREYYRLFSGDLVHNDLFHLLFNQIMLFTFGTRLEEYLLLTTANGCVKFVVIYLSSCLAGSLVTTIRHWKEADFTNVGTSGSIIGCMMSYVLLQPDIIAFYLPVLGGVKNIFGGLICIVAFMVYQFRLSKENINHEVHFFGALGGIVATLLLTGN
jgi:membrane associated rhomboid family serine protease